MARRSTPRKLVVDTAFPVRVKIRVPSDGLGLLLDECVTWLNQNVGDERFAQAATTSIGGNATAFHFVDVVDALRFVDAFPELELADGTVSRAYRSTG